MAKRVAGVRLTKADFVGAPPEPASVPVESVADAGGASDFVGRLQSITTEVRSTMSTFKEVLELVGSMRGMVPGGAPGAALSGVPGNQSVMPSSVAASPAPAARGPAAVDQRAAIRLMLAAVRAQHGDITMAELLDLAVRQYGGVTISEVERLLGGK